MSLWLRTVLMTSWQWRRHEINIAGARRGRRRRRAAARNPKGWTEGEVLWRGLSLFPLPIRDSERCKLPSGVQDKAPVAESFGAFLVLQVNTPAMQNCVYL